MAGTIKMTPQELRDGAQFLDQKKTEAIDILQQMNNKVVEVESNWEGAAQNSFMQTFNELYKQISTALPQTVEGIEQMLNGAAQTLEETDAHLASQLKM